MGGGLPYATAQWLNWFICATAAVLLWCFSPLPRFLKTLFLLSAFMLYEYAVVARPYGLSIGLFFSALALYPKRKEHPWAFASLLALLANSSVPGATYALPLAAFHLLDSIRSGSKRAAVGMTALLAGGFLASLLQLVPLGGDGIAMHLLNGPGDWRALSAISRDTFVLPLRLDDLATWLQSPHQTAIPLAGLTMLSLLMGTIPRPRALIFTVVSLLPLLSIFVWVGYGGIRHAGLFLVALVGALWLAGMEKDRFIRTSGSNRWARLSPLLRGVAGLILGLALARSMPLAFDFLRTDIRRPYSGGKEMAALLEQEGFAGVPIAGHPTAAIPSVLVYLDGVSCFYPGEFRHGTYLILDARHNDGDRVSGREALLRAIQEFRSEPRFFFLLGSGAQILWTPDACRVRSSTSSFVSGEGITLYECFGIASNHR